MSLSRRFIVTLFRLLTGCVFRIHDEALSSVPQHGPLIIVTNHINILEIPVIYAHLQPRQVHGLVLGRTLEEPCNRLGPGCVRRHTPGTRLR